MSHVAIGQPDVLVAVRQDHLPVVVSGARFDLDSATSCDLELKSASPKCTRSVHRSVEQAQRRSGRLHALRDHHRVGPVQRDAERAFDDDQRGVVEEAVERARVDPGR